MEITPADRAAIAAKLGVNEQYLYQCLTGRKAMKPEEAVRIEVESGRQICRWHVRRDDWHRIWPELIGAAGAPVVPDAAEQGA